jgi:peptidyl-prolyl cis-trans isomerase SurA
MHALLLSAALTTVGAPPAAPAGRELVDRIVAVINEDVVLLSELRAAAAPFLTADASEARKKEVEAAAMENLVADRLMQQQIVEAKLDVTPDDVDRAIADILRQNRISEAELTEAIEARGMTMAQYRGDLEAQIVRLKLVDLKVRSRVVVAEAEIKSEWERRTAGEAREELIRLRHLFFRWGESPDPAEKARVLERAKVAAARIQNGEDFAKVAMELSEGPTAAKGGELGELARDGLLPELSRATKTLPVGKLSPPVETANGVHVLRIDGVRKKEPTAYAELRNKLYQELYQKEVERQMKLWIDELKTQAAIEIRLD